MHRVLRSPVKRIIITSSLTLFCNPVQGRHRYQQRIKIAVGWLEQNRCSEPTAPLSPSPPAVVVVTDKAGGQAVRPYFAVNGLMSVWKVRHRHCRRAVHILRYNIPIDPASSCHYCYIPPFGHDVRVRLSSASGTIQVAVKTTECGCSTGFTKFLSWLTYMFFIFVLSRVNISVCYGRERLVVVEPSSSSSALDQFLPHRLLHSNI